MIRREAIFGNLFRHWLMANPRFSSAFELKQTTGTSLPFSAVPDHQLDALRAANNNGLLYKAPDDSAGVKPFDYFYLRNAPAYVVIRYRGFFVLIAIETFLHEKKMSKRKSLTGSRAKEISTVTVLLDKKQVG